MGSSRDNSPFPRHSRTFIRLAFLVIILFITSFGALNYFRHKPEDLTAITNKIIELESRIKEYEQEREAEIADAEEQEKEEQIAPEMEKQKRAALANKRVREMSQKNSMTALTKNEPSISKFTLKGKCGNIANTEDKPHAKGKGTLQSPYLICTARQLNNIRDGRGAISAGAPTNYMNAHFKMGRNIDMSESSSESQPIGSGARRFKGSFDGAGYTISNYRLVSKTETYATGFFKSIDVEGIAKNLHLKNLYFSLTGSSSSRSQVGGIAALNYGSIQNSSVIGTIHSGAVTGGIAGVNHGMINNSHAKVSIHTSGVMAGGIAGLNSTGRIQHSWSDGNIKGSSYIGGLVGKNESLISESYSIAAVSTLSNGEKIGGLAGSNEVNGIIRNAFAAGSVSGKSFEIGGLVGSNVGTIVNTYASGNVTGYEFVGGLIGSNTGSVSHSFASGNVDGTTTAKDAAVGPAIGQNESPKKTKKVFIVPGTSCSTKSVKACNSDYDSQMKQSQPLDDKVDPLRSWNFEGIWRQDSSGLPQLRMEPARISAVVDDQLN